MAADLEPIDIEINMQQNVSEEAGKAMQANEQMTRSVETMQKEIDRLNKVVADMSVALAEQRKITQANAGEFEGATRKIEEMESALGKASRELEAYQDISQRMNQASKEGADISDVLNDARKNLSQTEQSLIGNAHELLSNQEEINSSLDKSGKSVSANTASNQLLSYAIKEVCDSLGIENTQIKNAIGNVRVIQAAKTGWANAVKVLNTQLGLTVSQSKMLLGVGLATGIGAIVTVVALLVSHFKKLHEEQQETARLNRIVTDSLKNAASEGEKAAKKETVALKLLYDASQNEANSKQDRIQAARELQRLYPEYFENLSREEILAGRGADAYDRLTTSIIASAKARAAQDKIIENETKKLELEEKRAQALADKEAAESKIDIAGYKYNPQNAGGNPYAANAMNRQRGKEISEATAEMEEYNKTIWETTKEIGKYEEANRKLAERISVNDLVKDTKPTAGRSPRVPGRTEDKQAALEEKANKDLARKTAEYQKQIDAARIAAMEEGAEKQRATLKAEYDRTKAFIKQEEKELEELEKITGNPATGQRSQLTQLEARATEEYEAKLRDINEKSKLAIDAIFADAGQRFQSELDNNLLLINQYYDNAISAARKAGASSELINELNAMRAKELEQERIDAQMQSLEFDTQIALRRMAISGKFYLFESDKIRENLQKQKMAAKERLNILKEQYKKSQTKELAQDIEAATVEIEEMDEAIRRLDVSRLQEIAAYVSQIASGLGELLGEGNAAGKFLSWTADFADSAGKIASGIASGNPTAIIDGAFKAVGAIKDIFSTGSKVRKEIREFYRELEVTATRYAISVINAIKDVTGSTDSLFSTDMVNSLNKGMEGFDAAVQKEKDLVQQLGDTTVIVGKKKKKFLGITTGSKTVWESVLTGYKKVLDTDQELIDASGNLNREIAEALLNSGKLSKEAEDLISNIIGAQDAATQAMQQVEDTLSNIAGSIGDDLRSALVDAFRSGDVTAAADSFGKSASKILENWISQTMFSSVFGEMLANLEDKMKDSFGANGDQDITDDITWFMQNYQSGVDEYMKGLEKWKQQLKELYGIEVFGDGEREGTSAGLERISQDSANELNGNFYALRQQVGDIRNLQKEANIIRKAMQAQLVRIVENTEFCRYLLDVKNSLEDIQARGIKVKV